MDHKMSTQLLLMLLKAFIQANHQEIYIEHMHRSVGRYNDLLKSLTKRSEIFRRLSLDLVATNGRYEELDHLLKALERMHMVRTHYERERQILSFPPDCESRVCDLVDTHCSSLNFVEKGKAIETAGLAVKFYQATVSQNHHYSD